MISAEDSAPPGIPAQELTSRTHAIRLLSARPRRRRFRSTWPSTSTPTIPRPKPTSAPLRGGRGVRSGRCAGRTTEILSTEVAAWDPGVITAGEKVHDMAAGRLEHERLTGPVATDRAVTVIRGLPDCPSTMVTDDGEAQSAMDAVAGGGVDVAGGVVGVVSGGPAADAEVVPHCGA